MCGGRIRFKGGRRKRGYRGLSAQRLIGIAQLSVVVAGLDPAIQPDAPPKSAHLSRNTLAVGQAELDAAVLGVGFRRIGGINRLEFAKAGRHQPGRVDALADEEFCH